MSWEFFTNEGVIKEGLEGTIGDANTLDGKDSTFFIWRDGTVSMTAALPLHTVGDPGANNAAVSKQYVQDNFLSNTVAGDTVLGDLTLSAGVDIVLSNTSTLSWTGASISRVGSGVLTLGASTLRSTATPSDGTDLVNKDYVDDGFVDIGGDTL